MCSSIGNEPCHITSFWSSISYQSICGSSSEEHRTDIFKDDSNLHSWQLTVREILGQTVHSLPQISAADWYSIGQGKKSAQMFRFLMLSQEHCGIFQMWQGLRAGLNPALCDHQRGKLIPEQSSSREAAMGTARRTVCILEMKEPGPANSRVLCNICRALSTPQDEVLGLQIKETSESLRGLENSSCSILPFSSQKM